MRILRKPDPSPRRDAALICTIGLLAAMVLLRQSLFAEVSQTLLRAYVTANKQVLDIETQQAHAEGNVQLTFEEFYLRADRLDVDLKAETIDANGNVRVQWKGEVLKRRQRKGGDLKGAVLEGDRFHYQLGSKTGKLDNATITFDRLLFRGTEMVLSGKSVRIANASMTSCSRKSDPHYRVTCRSITIQSDRKLVLKKVTLWLGHRRIITVPSRTVNLGDKERQQRETLIPTTAFNKTDGILIQSAIDYPLSQRPSAPSLQLKLGLSSNRGFRGVADLSARSERLSYGVRLATQDVIADRLESNILVDKRPEVYFNLGDYSLGKKLTAALSASAGNIREQSPSRVTSNRSSVTLQLTPQLGSVERPSPFFGTLWAHKSWYDGGLNYRVFGGSLGLRGRLSRNVEGSLQFLANSIDGSTPFDFDSVEIPREFRFEADVALSRKWKVPLEIRYDLGNHEFPQKKIGLLRVLDCLEYGLTYDTARKEFHLAVRMVGLGR